MFQVEVQEEYGNAPPQRFPLDPVEPAGSNEDVSVRQGSAATGRLALSDGAGELQVGPGLFAFYRLSRIFILALKYKISRVQSI